MNTEGVQFVHWPGLACSAVGGMFWLVAYAKGKQKRELEAATPVSMLSGEWIVRCLVSLSAVLNVYAHP
jgi:hypothetical protein